MQHVRMEAEYSVVGYGVKVASQMEIQLGACELEVLLQRKPAGRIPGRKRRSVLIENNNTPRTSRSWWP